MPELNLQHIEKICRDVKRQEITFSHLFDDLIDHVCCDVENEMQNGLSFKEAYNRVKKKIGHRGLKEIQEETLYAVDTKYRKMKNTMKITGIAGTILFGFAALFKIQHWSGAGIMMTLGALILAFIFLPSALGVLWKETHSSKRLFLFISAFLTAVLYIMGTLFKIQHWPAAGIILLLTGFCGIFLFMPALLINRFSDREKSKKRAVYSVGAAGLIFYSAGMLFKIMHWPLASTFLIVGVLAVCIIALPWYTWLTWKEESHIRAGFIYLIIGTVLITVPGALLNLNLQNSYESGFFIQVKQQQVLYKSLYNNNQKLITQYHDSLNSGEIERLQSKTSVILGLIDKIALNMIAESEGKPGFPIIIPALIKETASGQEIQLDLLSKPFHQAPVRDFLLPGSSSRNELDTSLKEYLDYLAGIAAGEDNQKFRDLLLRSTNFPAEIPEGRSIPMISGLHSLMLLKNSILTLESNSLSFIAKR